MTIDGAIARKYLDLLFCFSEYDHLSWLLKCVEGKDDKK